MNDKCSHICDKKTNLGYCMFTACTNMKYNGSGTYIINKSYVNYLEKKKFEDDPDYGVGKYS